MEWVTALQGSIVGLDTAPLIYSSDGYNSNRTCPSDTLCARFASLEVTQGNDAACNAGRNQADDMALA